MSRVLVIGLDCAAPKLVFERYRDEMPHLSRLMDGGLWGPLQSVAPPITVPAWTCMVSGRDPGELGLYGFRNRVRGTYELRTASSNDVRVKRVWDYVGEAGRKVAVLFVPLTHPPPAVRGLSVSGFLWPGGDAPATYPEAFAETLFDLVGEYHADVPDFRTQDYARLYEQIVHMTEQHFSIARHVLEVERPDFTMMVEIGLDRFHHVFWEHIEPTHPRHDPSNPWRDLGRQYYGLLDREIGRLLEHVDSNTTVLVVSDHGAQNMVGGFAINQWLMEKGWLKLRQAPTELTRVVPEMVDWSQTRAWAEGGYYGRVFLNVRGREPEGIVETGEFVRVRAALAEELRALAGPAGTPLGVHVEVPRDTYRNARGFPPDLMAYFANLSIRALGSVGHPHLFVERNDTGHDGCNHDWDGVFVMGGPGTEPRGRIDDATLYDVTPTVLDLLQIEAPSDLLGRSWARP